MKILRYNTGLCYENITNKEVWKSLTNLSLFALYLRSSSSVTCPVRKESPVCDSTCYRIFQDVSSQLFLLTLFDFTMNAEILTKLQ